VISSYVILYDKHTSRLFVMAEVSKGYGFINCESKKTHNRILATKTHIIKGRVVEVNKALKKNSDIPDDIKSKGFRKLFIGGLRRSTSNDDLVQYFGQFGRIVNAYVIINPDTGLSKSIFPLTSGFGYVEFESVEVANHVLTLESHYLNNKKVTVENHKNSYNNTLKLCNMDSTKAPKKQKGSAASYKEPHQLQDDDGRQDSLQPDEESSESNHHGSLGNSTSNFKSSRRRMDHQDYDHIMDQSSAKQEHYAYDEMDFEEEESSEFHQRDMDEEEEEDDDDFNLGLLVPKSFDHDPDTWEQSPSQLGPVFTANLEQTPQQTPLVPFSHPTWKKQVKPCLANSQVEMRVSDQKPLQQTAPPERFAATKESTKVAGDSSGTYQPEQFLGAKRMQGSSQWCGLPERAHLLSSLPGSHKTAVAGQHSRQVPKTTNPKPQILHTPCAEFASREALAKRDGQLSQQGWTHPVSRDTAPPRTDTFPLRKPKTFPKGEGRPFVFCSNLLDERIVNYRFNTLPRRIGPMH